LRETLFDILQLRIEGATFLDAYAGTGAVGIEALSRGAGQAYFLERNRAALEAIRDNLASLELQSRAAVLGGPVLKNLAGTGADIVFLDPPYEMDREYEAVLDLLGAAPPALVVVQHSVRRELPEQRGDLVRTRVVKQGDNALSFYSPALTAPPLEPTPQP
jgi:16S rRNA (guanine(966)-N(2))-methyltransferase RsmD